MILCKHVINSSNSILSLNFTAHLGAQESRNKYKFNGVFDDMFSILFSFYFLFHLISFCFYENKYSALIDKF